MTSRSRKLFTKVDEPWKAVHQPMLELHSYAQRTKSFSFSRLSSAFKKATEGDASELHRAVNNLKRRGKHDASKRITRAIDEYRLKRQRGQEECAEPVDSSANAGSS